MLLNATVAALEGMLSKQRELWAMHDKLPDKGAKIKAFMSELTALIEWKQRQPPPPPPPPPPPQYNSSQSRDTIAEFVDTRNVVSKQEYYSLHGSRSGSSRGFSFGTRQGHLKSVLDGGLEQIAAIYHKNDDDDDDDDEDDSEDNDSSTSTSTSTSKKADITYHIRPSDLDKASPPPSLVTTLLPHQLIALNFLQWRELKTQYFRGGFLCDDMGLGKTLTMIALIASDVKPEGAATTSADSGKHKEKGKQGELVSQMQLLPADMQQQQQHQKKKSDKMKQKGKKTHPVSTTLIICPASLLLQWADEIDRHVRPRSMHATVFHGPKRKLPNFDTDDVQPLVVLATYETVTAEFKKSCPESAADDEKEPSSVSATSASASATSASAAATASATSSSSKKKAPKSNSPVTLFSVHWTRIVLDEGHKVKNAKALAHRAVHALHAKNRWIVTGTPIQNNLREVHAMLSVLHCTPFDDIALWKRDVEQAKEAGMSRLQDLLSMIMIRRTKDQRDAAGQPIVSLPTKEFVRHTVSLSDVERAAYKNIQQEMRRLATQFQPKSSSSSSSPSTTSSPSSAGILTLMLKLRLLCASPALVADQRALSEAGAELEVEATPDELAASLAALNIASPASSSSSSSSLSSPLSSSFQNSPAAPSPLVTSSSTLKSPSSPDSLQSAFNGLTLNSGGDSKCRGAKMEEFLRVLKTLLESKDKGRSSKIVVVSQWTRMLNLVSL